MESVLIYHMGYVKAHLAFNRKRIFYTTKVKIAKETLDSRGYVRAKAVDNWQNLNQQILFHKRKLDEAILKDLLANGTIDVDRIKYSLESATLSLDEKDDTPSVDKGSVRISDMLKEFISNQPKMNHGLKWRYELLLKILVKEDVICRQVKMPYLLERLDEFRGVVNANTASTRFKNFKRFILWCQEGGYPLPRIEWKRLRKPGFKPDFVFLTDDRIQQLIEYAPESIFEQNVKNIFLVLIYTGMRYSDYATLKASDIHDGHLDKVAKKTKTRFKIPVHQNIAEIVKSPPKMTGQVFNRGIKDLGEKLGWTELIRFRKDINEFVMIPYYDMLCSSVGRHTFATRALLNGTPHNIIMGWCAWCNSSMIFYYSEKIKVQSIDWMAKIK